jgi:DNA-binding MarR family transcriptional regulator
MSEEEPPIPSMAGEVAPANETDTDLVERIFACQHQLVAKLWNVAHGQEWSPLELLAMRALMRNGAMHLADLRHVLGISFQHMARVSKQLVANDRVVVRAWAQERRIDVTEAGREWFRHSHAQLENFAWKATRALDPREKRALFYLLAKLKWHLESDPRGRRYP